MYQLIMPGTVFKVESTEENPDDGEWKICVGHVGKACICWPLQQLSRHDGLWEGPDQPRAATSHRYWTLAHATDSKDVKLKFITDAGKVKVVNTMWLPPSGTMDRELDVRGCVCMKVPQH